MKGMSNRKKLLAQCVLTIIGIVLLWPLAISNTIEAVSSYNANTKKIETVSELTPMIEKLRTELRQIDQQLASSNNGQRHHEYLFSVVSKLAKRHELSIISYPAPVINQKASYEITDHKILVEGEFKKTVEFIYDLEKSQQAGRLLSTVFSLEIDRRTRKRFLKTTIVIRSLKNNLNND